MKALAARRHHRFAPVVLLLLALLAVGGIYAALSPTPASADTASADDIEAGQKLFQANCATCHGPAASGSADGPSLIGVGAASVNFQVSTGRMPMQMSGPQAPVKPAQFTDVQTRQLAAWVATLGAGPSSPTAEMVDPTMGNPAKGSILFRTNCSMCHNPVGAGGALSEGKVAPPLWNSTPTAIYEAMLTGPQSMPVFNDVNLTPDEKRDVIAYVVEQREPGVGGLSLGALGPVSEGLWVFVIGMGLLTSAAVWIGAKSS